MAYIDIIRCQAIKTSQVRRAMQAFKECDSLIIIEENVQIRGRTSQAYSDGQSERDGGDRSSHGKSVSPSSC